MSILKRKVYHSIFLQRFRDYSNLSYFHYPGKEPLRSLTVGQLLEQAAEKYKNRPAVISKEQKQTLTFQEVLFQADKLAAGFRSIGLHSGEKIGIWAPNLIEWFVTDMACARGGYILVNFNPAFQPNEMRSLINSIEINCLVCPRAFKSQDYYKHLEAICPELLNIPREELKSNSTQSLKSVVLIGEENLRGTVLYKDLLNLAPEQDVRKIQEYQSSIHPDHICHMQFTSGTTGTPKAPVQTHFQIVNNSYYIGKRSELDTKHHVMCVQVPFFHVFGTVATLGGSLNHGTTLVLPTASYDPDKSLDALRDEKCSVIYGTPTMYIDLIDRQKVRNEDINLEMALCGGAPCSPHLVNEMKRVLKLKKVMSAYGLSEATSSVFQTMYDDDEYHTTTTVGHLGDHLEAKVVDSEGRMVPKGVPGELLIRGYATTLGYYKNEEKTRELVGPDNWLDTGDQFILEENGYGKIVGRIKDVINRGGENVYPKEIEDVINTHPHVLESQVVGIPHERLGEEVCAVLRVKEKKLISLQDIASHCRVGETSRYQVYLLVCSNHSHFRIRTYTNLSYFHNPGKDPLRFLTVGQLLEKAAEKYKNRPSIISMAQKQTLTFQEVLVQADKLAAGFRSVGLDPGEKIGIWAPNLIEWFVTDMACARGGYILVNLNPAFQPNEMRSLINTTEINCLVCPRAFKSQDYYKHLEAICPELPNSPRGELKSSSTPSLKSVVLIGEENLRGTFLYKDLLNLASEQEVRKIQEYQTSIDPDQICHMQFTSGTTGTPKAPVQTHFQIVNNSYFVGKRNELHSKHHKICVQVPLFHVFGTVVTLAASLNHGATLVLPAASYNPDKSLDALRDEKCSIINGTPTMYVDLVNRQKVRNEDIKPEIAISGGAPCSPHLFKEMKRILKLKKVKSVYGLSETTSAVFQSTNHDDEYHSMTTVGRIGEYLEAKVVDSEGRIVPKGVPGELLIRGYATTLGYYKNEEKTKELIGPDKWLHTGDQFILEENGYGKIVGRIKDVIIRGGENVHPKEIEDVIHTHPLVLECQVVGIPHERFGEEICAVLRVKDKQPIGLQDIVSHCRGKLAHFKIPSKVELLDAFPKTASGKIQKFKLVHHVTNCIRNPMYRIYKKSYV